MLPEEALYYSAQVAQVQASLLLTSLTADTALDSYLVPRRESLRAQKVRELRQACCGGYYVRMGVSPADVNTLIDNLARHNAAVPAAFCEAMRAKMVAWTSSMARGVMTACGACGILLGSTIDTEAVQLLRAAQPLGCC